MTRNTSITGRKVHVTSLEIYAIDSGFSKFGTTPSGGMILGVVEGSVKLNDMVAY